MCLLILILISFIYYRVLIINNINNINIDLYMKIMIVEENRKMREMISNILTFNLPGIFEIFEYNNGEEALEQYESILPDWVFMDINFNGSEGFSVAEQLTMKDLSAKIIFLTQYDDPYYREKAKRIGAFTSILKDCLYEIVEVIKRNGNV